MALKIVWTLQAERNLQNVIDYLETEWTGKEVLHFEHKLKTLLRRISKYPEICPFIGRLKNVRRGLVDKNNYLIYKIMPSKDRIEIINFRGTRQEPL